MQQPITSVRVCRTLPTHELNARRARKQVLTHLPALKTPLPPPPAKPVRDIAWVPGWGMPSE